MPFDVPEAWEWTTLDEILELISGQDFPPEKYNNKRNGIPYIIGASNIENEELAITRWTDSPSVFSYKKDLLVVCKGAGVGKMAFNNIGTVHIARQIQAIRSYSREIEPEYVKIVVSCNIDHVVSNANGLIPGLKRELLLSLNIPLPPLAEQRRIVKEIKRWFSLIDIIENGKESLKSAVKQAKAKVLDLAIHGKLVPQDPTDEPASVLLHRINPKAEITSDNAQYGKIPEGWCMVKGKDLFKPMKSIKPSGITFKYIDIDSIDNKCNKIKETKTVETSKAPSRASRYTEKYDVVFSMVRPYLRNIAIVEENNCIASTGFYICSPYDYMYPQFCYLLMLSNYVVDGLNTFMKGDNSPSINKGNVDNWTFPLPPLAEQRRIVAQIEELFAQLDLIEAEL